MNIYFKLIYITNINNYVYFKFGINEYIYNNLCLIKF